VPPSRLHLIGGASEPASERASVGWHEVYDPQTDGWSQRKPLVGGGVNPLLFGGEDAVLQVV
jgi:hypothetical protein